MNVRDIKDRFGIVGENPQLNHAVLTAMQIAPIPLPVLVVGESGTGKEFFPQIIHMLSDRKHKPYVAVNCGAIPEGTIDSELFGHEKGSFTGAVNSRKGYFEEANGGTIFLDEIGELPLQTQVKLLRVLEKGEYMRVGSSVVQTTDVRIVAATNVNLELAVQNGKFREDLYYRLNGVMIRVPALRDRREDIPALMRRFISNFAAKSRVPEVSLTPEAYEVMKNYEWPGNVRQLKHTAEQITVLAKSRTLDIDDVHDFMPTTTIRNSQIISVDNQQKGQHFENEREILYKVLFDMRTDMQDLKKLVIELLSHVPNGTLSREAEQTVQRLYAGQLPTTTAVAAHQADVHAETPNVVYDTPNIIKTTVRDNSGHISPTDYLEKDAQNIDERMDLGDYEKQLIESVLAKHHGRRQPAADELGYGVRTLFRKMKKYGIDAKKVKE
ncbi:MAG: sigma-54 dependent transcriptional regulator [Marinilabiliaceae bacterium]|nr:sigma-54 dependent transcriptional regulator [Marinilabiliaceae bacterium]